ncbi:MAG TPA: GntR family transcriptional regulator, partial [Ilumatobacteraceae bacterium]
MIASRSPNAIVAPKLATLVAQRIEQQVVASGWPIGDVLGSESELIDRYGVSRAVLREAVRIVEHNGVARMRGGRGGGLIVAEPNTEAVNAAITVWFSYIGVAASEMYDAHLAMTSEAMRRGAELRDHAAVTALRAEIDAMVGAPDLGRTAFLGLAGKFLALTDNPAVVLFANALSGLLNSPLRGAQSRLIPRMSVDQARAHLDEYAQLADAIDSGDTDGAEHLTSVLFATAR